MSDDNKPKLGMRAPLGLGKTVEVGKVKQSFSHGRTKQVVVEVKRQRILHRPGDPIVEAPVVVAPEPVATPVAPPAPPRPEPAAVAPAPAPEPVAEARPLPADTAARPVPPPVMFTPVERPVPVAAPEPAPAPEPVVVEAAQAPAPVETPAPAPAPAPPVRSARATPRPAERTQSRTPERRPQAPAAPDLMTRQERQAALLRQADGDRMKMAEDARIREEAARYEAAEMEKMRLEDKKKAEAEAALRPPEEKAAPSRLPGSVTPIIDDEEEGRRGAPGKPGAARPAGRLGARDDRRQGRLSVKTALEGEDSTRVRSLAALRRAREKERGGRGSQSKQVRDVIVPDDGITVAELANRMAERTSNIVRALARLGLPAASVDEIDQDTAELVLAEFGHNIVRVSDADVEIGMVGDADIDDHLVSRPPVVTIMGHVDHGKTSLLDALRGTNVVKGEAGGITQHIGAYQIATKGGDKITFLDTPGHEAFTAMRARGADITDIVVLVVAWDDGIMPQTIEAIAHTKAAGVPMIVAINKMDKAGADAQRIRTALLQYDVQVEELGGDVQDVEVSATAKTGLDELIDKILLQSEVLELKSNPDRPAEGTVIEAKLDKGRGPLASVLVQRGTLKTGDIFVIGAEWGKVRALVDDQGKQIKTASPALPVEILGLSGVPRAGDAFAVVETEARAREVASYRASLENAKRNSTPMASLEDMFTAMKAAKVEQYPLVIKGDTQGSVEAIASAVNNISTSLINAKVLLAGVGGITESDVTLAKASGAPIIGFNVRANAKAREIAQRDGVALKYYDVIYALIDDVKAAMAGQLGPEFLENVVGRALVLDVFQAGKTGKAAGIRVTEGIIRKALKARVTRDDVIIYNGAIASLRRFKDDVAEVRAGLECGITLEGSSDVKAGDFIETFEVEQRERTL